MVSSIRHVPVFHVLSRDKKLSEHSVMFCLVVLDVPFVLRPQRFSPSLPSLLSPLPCQWERCLFLLVWVLMAGLPDLPAMEALYNMCRFQKISIPPPRKVVWVGTPLPPGISSLASILRPLSPSEFLIIDLPWGGYGYFLEPHNLGAGWQKWRLLYVPGTQPPF